MHNLIDVQDVTKEFSSGFLNNRKLIAVRDVSLKLPGDAASTVALAGESGSGKTTLAQMILGFLTPTRGHILIDGHNLFSQGEGRSHQSRSAGNFRYVQAVFQNPYEAFNPFYPVKHIFRITVAHYKLATDPRHAEKLIADTLHAVHLDPGEVLGRYPHQLSGGQLQRLMIARSLLLRPKLLVADEPVSMVDVSLRAMILDLLAGLKREYGISILYITHDLSTALQIADSIMIMYQGSMVEMGNAVDVIQNPTHPYTQLLVQSIPLPDPEQRWSEPLSVKVESALTHSTGTAIMGCPFWDRCPERMKICMNERPPLFPMEGNRQTACFLYQ